MNLTFNFSAHFFDDNKMRMRTKKKMFMIFFTFIVSSSSLRMMMRKNSLTSFHFPHHKWMSFGIELVSFGPQSEMRNRWWSELILNSFYASMIRIKTINNFLISSLVGISKAQINAIKTWSNRRSYRDWIWRLAVWFTMLLKSPMSQQQWETTTTGSRSNENVNKNRISFRFNSQLALLRRDVLVKF